MTIASDLRSLRRRVDMMLSRGFLRGTVDSGGVQRMQVGALEGETLDNVERFQTFGLSTVPPPGGDVLLGCVAGNRDHPIVIAVNDRSSRPKGLRDGESVLYNSFQCFVSLSAEGDVIVRGARNVSIEGVEAVTIRAGEAIQIASGTSITLAAPASTITANGNVLG